MVSRDEDQGAAGEFQVEHPPPLFQDGPAVDERNEDHQRHHNLEESFFLMFEKKQEEQCDHRDRELYQHISPELLRAYADFIFGQKALFNYPPDSWVEVCRTAENDSQFGDNTLLLLRRIPYFDEEMEMLPEETVTVELFGEAKNGLLLLLGECAEKLVPDNEHVAEVLIEIRIVARVVYAVVRGRYQYVFQNAQLADYLRVREKRIKPVDNEHGRDHRGRKADEWQHRPEGRPHHRLEDRNASAGRVIELLARVVYDVKSPEQVDFVAHPVIPIPHQVGCQYERDPDQQRRPDLEQPVIFLDIVVKKEERTGREHINKPLQNAHIHVGNGAVEIEKLASKPL